MGSGPVCAMVWEGRDVVKTGRAMLGATNPLASQPGTIRGDFAIVRKTFRPPLFTPAWTPHPFLRSCLSYVGKRWTGVLTRFKLRTSAAISATAPTPWRARRRRLRCGSARTRCRAISRVSRVGFTRSRERGVAWI